MVPRRGGWVWRLGDLADCRAAARPLASLVLAGLKGAGLMRTRALIGGLAAAIGATLATGGAGAAAAQAATTCTWGGTPAAPTGMFTIKPGLTARARSARIVARLMGP